MRRPRQGPESSSRRSYRGLCPQEVREGARRERQGAPETEDSIQVGNLILPPAILKSRLGKAPRLLATLTPLRVGRGLFQPDLRFTIRT